MQKNAATQDRINALEAKIFNQRKATSRLDNENKRLREFVRALGYDPDDLRYTDRQAPTKDIEREADRRLDALERGVKLLELGLPITALENMKDDLRSMQLFGCQEQTETGT